MVFYDREIVLGGGTIMLNMPAFLLRKKMIIKKLAQCGATSENSAKTLAEAGILNPNAFPKIIESAFFSEIDNICIL